MAFPGKLERDLSLITLDYSIVKDSNADLTVGKLKFQNRPIISNSSGLA